MPGIAPTLAELATDLLLVAIAIQRPNAKLPSADALRLKIKAKLEEIARAAETRGFGRPEIEDVRFALVATIDEALQFSAWTEKVAWGIHPLQVELFGERNAGIRFFERLDRIRPQSRDVLEVYYLCLMSGFRGRYRMAGEEEVTRLLDGIALELGYRRQALSPQGLRSGPTPARPRRFPWVAVAVGLLFGSVVAWGAMYFTLDSARNQAVQMISR